MPRRTTSTGVKIVFVLLVLVVALIVVSAWGGSSVAPAAGDRPPAGRMQDGPLSEADAAAEWAPLYLNNGGLRTVYAEIYSGEDCAVLQESWDRNMDNVRSLPRGSDQHYMVWGYALAASWRGDDIGCPAFEGMNDGKVFPTA